MKITVQKTRLAYADFWRLIPTNFDNANKEKRLTCFSRNSIFRFCSKTNYLIIMNILSACSVYNCTYNELSGF